MKTICMVFGHKMYSISWTSDKFTVLCTRCEQRWENTDE